MKNDQVNNNILKLFFTMNPLFQKNVTKSHKQRYFFNSFFNSHSVHILC